MDNNMDNNFKLDVIADNKNTISICVDIINSTKIFSKVEKNLKKAFYIALYSSIHRVISDYEYLNFSNLAIKYTGDGFYVSFSQEDENKNIYLQSIFLILTIKNTIKNYLEKLIEGYFGNGKDEIRELLKKVNFRYSIGTFDNETLIKNEKFNIIDYIGDSIRRAVRISNLCEKNQILIDDLCIDSELEQNFQFEEVDIEEKKKNNPHLKIEEDIKRVYLFTEIIEANKINFYSENELYFLIYMNLVNLNLNFYRKILNLNIKTLLEAINNRYENNINSNFIFFMDEIVKHFDNDNLDFLLKIIINNQSIDKKDKEYIYYSLVKDITSFEVSKHLAKCFLEEKVNFECNDRHIINKVIKKINARDKDEFINFQKFDYCFDLLKKIRTNCTNLDESELNTTYILLIKKSYNFDIVKKVYLDIIEPDKKVFNELIKKASTEDDISFILNEISSHKIKKTDTHYSLLMKKANSYDKAKKFLDEFLKESMNLKKTNYKFFFKMLTCKIPKGDEELLNSTLDLIKEYFNFNKFVKENRKLILSKGINQEIIILMLNGVKTNIEAKKILDKLSTKNNINYDAYIINLIIKKTSFDYLDNFLTKNDLYKSLDKVNMKTLLKKINRFEDIKYILSKIKIALSNKLLKNEIFPFLITYCLVEINNGYLYIDDLKEFIIKELGIKQSVFFIKSKIEHIITSLLKQDYQEALDIATYLILRYPYLNISKSFFRLQTESDIKEQMYLFKDSEDYKNNYDYLLAIFYFVNREHSKSKYFFTIAKDKTKYKEGKKMADIEKKLGQLKVY